MAKESTKEEIKRKADEDQERYRKPIEADLNLPIFNPRTLVRGQEAQMSGIKQ